MQFLYPAAFFGAVSVPVILVFYLLKQKPKTLEIPSVFLWRAAVGQNALAQKPWQKLRKNLLMLLQLLFAALLVCAAAGPFFAGGTTGGGAVFVLDCSMSMGTADGSANRFEAAKKAVAARIDALSPGETVSLIAMQKEPYIAVAASGDKGRLLSALAAMPLTHTAADAERTAALAQSVGGGDGYPIYCFSDSAAHDFGGLPFEPAIFGVGAQNTAVTAVSGQIEGDALIVMAKIKHYGNTPVSNTLVFYADGVVCEMTPFTLAPRTEESFYVTGLPLTTASIEVRLSEPDALPSDDKGYLAFAETAPKKVLLVTAGNRFLENMFGLLPGAALYQQAAVAAADASASGAFLYVYDGLLPEDPPEDGHILLFNPPEGNTLIPTEPEQPLPAESSHSTPAFSFTDGLGFAVKTSKTMTLPDWATESVTVGDRLLMAAGTRGGQKIMVVGFDLHDTDLPLKKEYPVWLYHIFEWFAPQTAGGERTALLCGDSLTPDLLPNTREASVTAPNGTRQVVAPPFPPSVYTETDAPGLYLLTQQTTAGEQRGMIAVNAFLGEESDVSAVDRDSRPSGAAAGQTVPLKMEQAARFDLNRVLLPALLVLILLEWWVYSRDTV